MTEKSRAGVMACRALRPFGTSIFTEMTSLAMKSGAVNLSQGFPDFDGPDELKRAAAEAVWRGPNQYVPSAGLMPLRRALAGKMERFYGVELDPETQITVTSGASEGLAATLLGLLEPEDEVILLEPCYDLYAPIIMRAGARPVYVSLDHPGLGLPREGLEKAFNSRTRAIIINNPLNPSGKVFSDEELDFIGSLCGRFDALAIGDEVYEHLLYNGHSHKTLLAVPSLKDRCLVISSTAKTFSMTGWKVGWVMASPALSEAVRMCHQYLTFCTPGPFQEAMSLGISMGDGYFNELRESYTGKRELLCRALADLGLEVYWPEGTYYASINISGLDFADDLAFCRFLTTEVGVAAIPSSFFWQDRRGGRDLARFCFCKKDETLLEAVSRLRRWRG